RSLVFHPTTEDRSLEDALHFVLENAHRRGEWLAGEVDLSFAGERWRALIRGESNGHSAFNRRHLEVCVFYHLSAELKTGDLCVEGSEKYADYREQLLSW
ncbi:MAG: Tn3 family transposase, partial [Rubrobacter sp.]|nr:Tn3 family transposase [Rubrobacter sp.]